MTNEYLADVLDEAAQLLDQNGWRRDQLIDDEGKGETMCISGAVGLASGHTLNSLRFHITALGDDANDTHRAAMKEVLNLIWGDHGMQDTARVVENWVAIWNDKTCQNNEEAQALLQKAAAGLRERVE